MNKIIPSKFFTKSKGKVLISPLGLLVLAACSGGKQSATESPTEFTREGTLVKGPLKDALAFLDYDGNKTQSGDEPFVRSNEDGSYSLTGSAGNENANIVAITDGSTVDTASGTVLSGITLSAPATASVVSMASTLMVESSMTEAQVQAALGISGDVDLLAFNPFSISATATDAEKELAKNIEVSSQQVGAVLTALTASAAASGMTAADAFSESLKAVSEFVKTKSTASEAVDLTDTTQLKAVADTVKAAVQTKSLTDSSIDAVAFANMQTTIVSAVSNVNSTIASSVTKDNFSGADAAKIYSVSQVLVDQVSSAVTAEKADKGSGQSSITFDDQAAVTTAAANAAPTDIDLVVDGSPLADGSSLSVSEGVGSLDVANVSVTDDTSTTFTFELTGDDASSFSISTDGILSFNSQPDFETKDSYSFAIQATDEGGKSFVESFTVKITDIDEAFLAARGQIITDQSQDATFDDYVNGPAGTFKAPAAINFTFADGVVSFGKIELDLININKGLTNDSSFVEPSLDVVLARTPDVSGSKTETIKIVVVDGSDSARDASSERSFEISFDAVMSGTGSTFNIAPQPTAKVSYFGVGDTSATEVVLTSLSNDTLSYNYDSSSSVGTMSVKFLSLINQITNVVPSNVFGSGGEFHATMTGLPLMNEDGTEVTSLVGTLNISDRDHTPLLNDPGTKAGVEDGASVTGKLIAQDAENDSITYAIDAVTSSGGEAVKVGKYGTLTVNNTSGDYSYVINNANATVNALSNTDPVITEEFVVTASDGKSTGSDKLTFTIQGVNDALSNLSLSNSSVSENQSGAVVGILSATDPEGAAISYSVTTNTSIFEAAAYNGQLVLKIKDGVTVNHEANDSYSVTVTASDGIASNDITKIFTISVTDLNEAPILAQPVTSLVTEGVTETISGTLIASDPDAGQVLTYGITGGSSSGASTVKIEGVYGALSVNTGTGAYSYTLDKTKTATQELSASDQVSEIFKFTATDNASSALTATKNFTVNISGTDSGAVLKGPLHNAIVFNDYSGDGQLTDGEPWVRTDTDGSYSLTPTSNLNLSVTYDETGFNKSDYSIVVAMDNNTKDHTSGESFGSAGVTLKAAPGGSVVTPMTSLHEHSKEHSDEHGGSFTAAELAAVLLPTKIGSLDTSTINILTFNTHADGVDKQVAHEIETIQQHLMTTVQMVQSVIKGAGTPASGVAVTDAIAHDVAQDALIKLIIHTHKGSNASISGDLDLSDAAHLEELEKLIEADLASGDFKTSLDQSGASVPGVVLEYVLDHASKSINLMNAELDKLDHTKFAGVDAGAVSHLKHDMAEEILVMATAARAHFDSNANSMTGFDGDSYLSLTTQSAIDAKILSNRTEVLTHLQEASPLPDFKVSTDATSGSDAVFTDYIDGKTTSAALTNIDLQSSSGVLSFGTVTVDSNNLKSATEGGSGYLSPTLTLSLDQIPRIAGSKDYDVKVVVTEGSDAVRASGERSAEIAFTLSLSGDGETASLTASAGGSATISYFGSSSSSAATMTINNSDADVISFIPGANGVPATLNLKTLEILNKVSALNPTQILGEGATAHVKVTGLPLADESGAITSIEGSVVVKDLIAPATTITRASYDSATGELTIQGTKFDELDVEIGGDVKSYLDWSKLTWDINKDGSDTADVIFSEADFTSAIVKNAETLVITVNNAKKSILEGTSGYGGSGGDDAIDVSAGFIRDKALNLTSDGTAQTDAASDVVVVNVSELVRISTDASNDFTIKDYVGGAVASTQNLTTTISGGVLNFGTASLDSYNIAKGAEGSSDFKSPEVTLNIDSAALIAGTKTVPIVISIIDGGDASLSSTERRVDVEFSINLSGNGTKSSFSTSVDQTASVKYYAAGDPNPTVLPVTNIGADTFDIATGSNGLPSTATLKALSLIEKISSLSPSSILGEGGSYYLTISGLPLADEVSYISSVQGVLTIENKVPPFKLSTDTTSDVTVTDYLDGTTAKVDYSDLSMSGNVLNFSQVYFDLANAQKGAAGNSGFTSPKLEFVLDSVPNIAGSDSKSVTLTIVDGTDSVASGSERKVEISFDVTYTSDGSSSAITAANGSKAIITYVDSGESASVTITNLTQDILNISSGSNSSPSTLSVNALAIIDKVNSLSLTPTDILSSGGDYHLTLSGLPLGDENNSATSVQGVVTIKDRVPPTSTVDTVSYDSVAGTIVLNGTKFDTIDASTGADVKAQIDFSKISWDIEGDNSTSANVSFSANDFSSVILTSATKLTFTLTSTAKNSLESASGFAASGLDGKAGANDTVDISEGFISDLAGNKAATDAKTDAVISYSDLLAPTLTSFTTTSSDGAYGVGLKVNVTATLSEPVLEGSTFTATLNTGSSTASKNTVTLEASQTGATLVGVYTVPTGVTSNDLSVNSFSYTAGAVKDVFGNALESISIPTGKNIADSAAIVIDTLPPTSTISSAEYDGNTGTITITGDDFNKLGVNNGVDVKAYLNWKKITWDIDFDDTNSTLSDVTFEEADITSAVVTNKTTLTVVLTSEAKASLHATTGFAAEGDASKPSDSIDVAAGFIRDTALNAATTDAKDNATLTYADTTAPTISSITADKSDGAYGVGAKIKISATASEKVISSSEFVATLNTNDTVTLTADSSGLTLSGDYVVSSGDNKDPLDVSSITAGSVKDIYGTSMASTSLSSVTNLADNKTLKIDTNAPTATIDEVEYDGDSGKFTFKGDNFNTIDVTSGSILDFLNFDNLDWDINADNTATPDVTFTKSDFGSAAYVSATSITATLTAEKKASLEATSGFAADGGPDTIDVTAGFVRDHALNAATTDSTLDQNTDTGATLNYTDTARPTVTKFTSTNNDGSYGVLKKVNVTATMSENVIMGSKFTATLTTGSNQTVILEAKEDENGYFAGNILFGEYEVPTGVSSPDLGITSYEIASGQNVTDVYGNTMTSTTIPPGQNLSNNSAIVIDTLAPTSNVTSATYNTSTGVLALTGTDFDTLGISNGEDAKAHLNWDQFSWDIEGDNAATSNVSFDVSDIETAEVTNSTTITITLTPNKKTALESTDGFAGAGADGKAGLADTIDVSTGFFVDTAGNVATGDFKADVAITYSDTTRPTVTKFTSTNADGSYGLNSPVNITATMSESVLKGSSFVVTLDTTDTVTLTAKDTGTTLTGTYGVSAGKATTDLSVDSYTTGTVTDIVGNTMNAVVIPTGQNLSNNSAIVIDTTAPTSTITSASYNGSTGALTITGTNFDELGITNGGSVSALLDWSKFSWDINGDDTTTANASLASSDIDTALLVSDTSMTITLKPTAKSTLEATAGFAAAGGADTIDVGAGFLKDTAGNAAATDATLTQNTNTGATLTYSDTARPTVSAFSSSTSNGAYGLKDTINVTATMSEQIIAGSKFTVTLNAAANATLVLEADEDDISGTTLTGIYEIPANITTADLTVSSFELASGQAVTDVYGNTMTSTSLPTGQNLGDNAAISIDTNAPISTVASASYNGVTGVITLTGTNFDTLGLSNGSNVLSQLDLTKISWDIDGDDATTANVSFSGSDLSSAKVTNATTLTLTLTSDKKASLEATSGFGASGSADTIDVLANFTKDTAGNPSITDDVANATLSYADTARPTISNFSTTKANGNYTTDELINITATASETILSGGEITVTLNTNDEVILTASETGTTLSGDYKVSAGDNTADLSISSYTLGSGTKVVQDIYGNEANSTTIPSGKNLSDNAAIVIDTTLPTTTIGSAKYDGSTGVLTLTGENFDSLNVSNGADVKANLNWSKLSWDIDGDDTTTANVSFSSSDITSAIVTNAQTLTITLTSNAKSTLEATTKFAASGSADKIDVSAGFILDTAGNEATTDAKADAALTYTDTTAPKLTSFSSTKTDGSYNNGDEINITANMSESVLEGSSFIVTLNTTDTVTLTADANGKTLAGIYKVSSGDSSTDLGVTSFTTGSVSDIYGNTLANTTIPTGQNLSNNSDLVIDNIPIFANGTGTLTQNDGNSTADAGDTVQLKFSEAVSNTSAVSAQFTGSTTYGAGSSPASASWSNSNKTLTITLGAGEAYGIEDISISSLLDAADNETTTLTFDVV